MNKFSWKNWPYWIRGGVVAVVFSVVFLTILPDSIYRYAFNYIRYNPHGTGQAAAHLVVGSIGMLFIVRSIIFLPLIPFLIFEIGLGESLNLSASASYLFDYAFTHTYIFILGALIGLIYGKIKKRRNYAAN